MRERKRSIRQRDTLAKRKIDRRKLASLPLRAHCGMRVARHFDSCSWHDSTSGLARLPLGNSVSPRRWAALREQSCSAGAREQAPGRGGFTRGGSDDARETKFQGGGAFPTRSAHFGNEEGGGAGCERLFLAGGRRSGTTPAARVGRAARSGGARRQRCAPSGESGRCEIGWPAGGAGSGERNQAGFAREGGSGSTIQESSVPYGGSGSTI